MKRVILIILCLSLCGCVSYPVNYSCGQLIEQMNGLWCEDATMVGYTSAYLGHEKWKELTDSYNVAREKSPYGFGCGRYNGHWLGKVIHKPKGDKTYDGNLR
jgi:hypothetical protein